MKGIIGMIFVPIFTRPIVFVNVRAIIFGKGFGTNTHRNILFDKNYC